MLQSFLEICISLLLLGWRVNSFYLPGVNPHSFADGDLVKLKVNKMTSAKTLIPVDYYRLPFCHPDGGAKMDTENLGEFLAGDRIESSPYRLEMKKEMYCEQVCITNLGRGESTGISPNKVIRAIRKNYHNNWIVDNLPSASKAENGETMNTKFWQGFPIGFIDSNTHVAYIHNHVNIEIQYHAVETEVEKYRIVRFMIEPFSIKHDFEPSVNVIDETKYFRVAKILNPIISCEPRNEIHTTYKMVTEDRRQPQLANGKVLFTYDVTWLENKELHWASRWDIYLNMNNFYPTKIHWLSICNSVIIILVLSAMIVAILFKNLRRDLRRYNSIPTDEEKADDLEEYGWKLVHADVFRPPLFSPMALAVCCGSGVQLICMSILTIIFSVMGFLSPASRGSLLMALLLFYVLMGTVNGYTTAHIYKTFKGKNRRKLMTVSALFVPSVAFGMFFILDILALTQKSTDAVPFTTMIGLLVLWVGISIPLVFVGSYFGFKCNPIDFPVSISNIPRQIPDQPWFMGMPFVLIVGGILPFGTSYVELYFIMSSIWLDQYYYVFGFLFLTFLLLVITCAEISILFNYFQLCGEDYRWWWRSFATSGSTALYLFCYAIFYFKQLETNMFATYMLFFGYMSLASFATALMTGTIGVLSSLRFNKIIYGSIKID